MRITFSIREKCLIKWPLPAIAAVLVFVAGCYADPQTDSTVYDANPKHLWNRLNQTLFQRKALDGRKYGLDELDILYWPDTTNLVVGPSHRQALSILDEFINSHGEKLISDPLKRALLQRDLWELFDWSTRQGPKLDRTTRRWAEPHPAALRELQTRLATLIRRLELSTNEISSLPDNYAQADAKGLPGLPHDLFDTNGDWVSVGVNAFYPAPIAPSHLQSFDGHSAFSVMLRMPGGRKAAIDYLDKLRAFAQSEHTLIYRSNSLAYAFPNAPKEVLVLNPEIPQFPSKTEWVLVRQMCIIDSEGNIQPTRVCESIQVRRYNQIKPIYPREQDAQAFFQFDLDKGHGAALRTVSQDEKDFNFVQFRGGEDVLEYRNAFNDWLAADALQHEVLQTCFACHSGPAGIRSVLSYTGSLAPIPLEKPTDVTFIPYTREAEAAISWKKGQFSWGLLQGLWLRKD